MVNVGYGNDKLTRHVLPNRLKSPRVSNVKEIEILIMHNRAHYNFQNMQYCTLMSGSTKLSWSLHFDWFVSSCLPTSSLELQHDNNYALSLFEKLSIVSM